MYVTSVGVAAVAALIPPRAAVASVAAAHAAAL